jgi:hypothetical protein
MVSRRVKPEDPAASAGDIAVAYLPQAIQALLLCSQFLALGSEVRSNRLNFSLE